MMKNRIKELRQKNHLTLKEVSQKIGMSNTKFGMEITKRFKKKKTMHGIFYYGVDLVLNQQFGFN